MAKGEKTTQQGSQNATTTYTPDPSMVEENKIQLGQVQANDPIQRQVNQFAGNDISALLTGNSGQGGAPQLQGFLGTLAQGINPDVTNTLVNQSLRDVNTQLAKSGAGTMMESGASQSIGARTAGDIRMGSEQFNLGNLLNLLNIGVGGQAQIQQPMNQVSQMLGGRLAGLTGSTQTGNYSGSTIGMNPFLKSFQQSAGAGFGNAFNPQTYIGSGKMFGR